MQKEREKPPHIEYIGKGCEDMKVRQYILAHMCDGNSYIIAALNEIDGEDFEEVVNKLGLMDTNGNLLNKIIVMSNRIAIVPSQIIALEAVTKNELNNM
jgi:hypothetical protein